MFTNKKVLVITTTDNMIWQFLLPHIQYLKDKGNEVECVCAKTGFWFDEMKDSGLTMHEIGFSRSPMSLANIKGYKKLKKLFKEKKYDIVFCHQPVGGVMGRLVGSKFHVPVIYVAHGFHFFKGNSRIKNFVYGGIERFMAKKTYALVTMNEEDFEAAKNFKAKKVYKINGIGVDFSHYEKDVNPSLRKELGIPEDAFVVVSIGELNENKNHCKVIEAINNLKNNNVYYLICGIGKRKDEYLNFAEANGLTNNLKLLGFRKDIGAILNSADLFVMPSLREGLPKSLMEAMSVGLPAVVSNIRGCKDLIENENGGFLVTPTSVDEFERAIKKLYEDFELRRVWGERNREFVKSYSIENVLLQMKNIYEEVEI